MTRDTYAKEVIKAAEAAFYRDETPLCPHEDCGERLSIVRQSTFSTRSLYCPVHGHIFQEQERNPFGSLDWEGAAQRIEAMQAAEVEQEEELGSYQESDRN